MFSYSRSNNRDPPESTNKLQETSNGYLVCQPFRLNTSLLDEADDIFRENQSQNRTSCLEDPAAHPTRLLFPEYTSKEWNLIEHLKGSKDFEEALMVLEQMWRDMKFCDLILATDQSEYLAHQIVFAHHSRILRELFKKTSDEFVVCIKVVVSNEKSFRKILRYMYTNQICLSIRTVESVIECSKTFQLTDLMRVCEDYLITLMPKHMLVGLQIARRQRLVNIENECLANVVKNYETALSFNFFELDAHLALECVKQIKKSIFDINETFLLEKAVEWAETHRIDSPKDTLRLLEQIDYSRIDSQYLRSLAKQLPAFLEIPKALERIKRASKPKRSSELISNMADPGYKIPNPKPISITKINIPSIDPTYLPKKPKLKRSLFIGVKARLLSS